jgi:hypothetical protein
MWDVAFDGRKMEKRWYSVSEWLGLGSSSDLKGKSSGVEGSGAEQNAASRESLISVSAWKSERHGEQHSTVHDDSTVID